MNLMKGKKGLIMGVANERCMAWGICQKLAEAGAELELTYLGDGQRISGLGLMPAGWWMRRAQRRRRFWEVAYDDAANSTACRDFGTIGGGIPDAGFGKSSSLA